MNILPELVIFEIGLNLDYKSLKRFGQSNKAISNVIQQKYFWEQKLVHDYSQKYLPGKYEPKELYYSLLARKQCFPGAEKYTTRTKCLVKAIEKEKMADIDYFLGLYGDGKLSPELFFLAGKSCNEIIIAKLWHKINQSDVSVYRISRYESNLAQGVGKSGNLTLIEQYRKNARNIEAIIMGASSANHKLIVAALLDKYSCTSTNRAALKGACIGGHIELLSDLVNTFRPPRIMLNVLLSLSCKQNDLKIVKLLINAGATNYISLVNGSIRESNLKFLEWTYKTYRSHLLTYNLDFFIKKVYAIGNPQIIEFLTSFIDANNLTIDVNYALYGACSTANVPALKHALKLNPTDWHNAFPYLFKYARSYPKKSLSFLDFILKNGYIDPSFVQDHLSTARLQPAFLDSVFQLMCR